MTTPADSPTIALYGGSFDPPHIGHLFTVLYLLSCRGVERVWLLPAFHHPFAKQQTDFDTRLAMCRVAVEPFGERVQVMATERELGGSGKTLHLIEHLLAHHPKTRFLLAIGADNYAAANKWYRFDEIKRLVELVVIGRAGTSCSVADIELPNVNSSEIRRRVAAGQPIAHWVPQAVLRLVETHGLYRNHEPRTMNREP